MNGYFAEAGTFLINVVFSFFILMVMLRFLLQLARADFYNPISQFIVKLSDPMLKPLRRIIPGLGGIDMASIALLISLKLTELLLTILLNGAPLNILVLLILTLTSLISLCLYVYIFAIIIMAVASWINPGGYNPVLALIDQLTVPVMRPVQKRMKPVSGMDLSPLVVLLILNLLVMAIPHLQNSLFKLIM